jgi:hypothetical protein
VTVRLMHEARTEAVEPIESTAAENCHRRASGMGGKWTLPCGERPSRLFSNTQGPNAD